MALIAIDALYACRKARGLSMYAKGIIKTLTRMDKHNKYLLLIEDGASLDTELGGNFEVLEIGKLTKTDPVYAGRLEWDQVNVANALRQRSVDLFFNPVFMLPLERPCPAVTTIHDMIAVTHPHFYSLEALGYYGVWGRLCANSADGIITMSKDSKQLISQIFNVPRSKITVGYAGISSDFRVKYDVKKRQSLKNRLNLEGDYILYVGGVFPKRKNFDQLLYAYAELPERTKRCTDLVFLTGQPQNFASDNLQAVLKTCELLNIQKYVKVFTYLDKADLVTLYNGAKLCVYASLYEGFGFPPLEAMACGKVVVANNRPAMDELLTQGAVLVNPTKISEMSAAIEHLLTDNAKRIQMEHDALALAKKFTWARTGKLTLTAFNRVLQKSYSA